MERDRNLRPRTNGIRQAQAADARVNVELDTGDMTLNIGPQHPATHGTLRIACQLDGEQVVVAEPIMGYMHRGYEKLCEVRTYPQCTTLINRIDWLGSFANEVPFILAAERLMEVEAPPRAQWIRTILLRTQSHSELGFVPRGYGCPNWCADAGLLRFPRSRTSTKPNRRSNWWTLSIRTLIALADLKMTSPKAG